MDTFIDKLAQKTVANDMISANSAAEARENQRLKDQLASYEEILQEMKQVNLKNIESASKVSDMISQAGSMPSKEAAPAVDSEEIMTASMRASEKAIAATKSSTEEIVAALKSNSDSVLEAVKANAENASGMKASSEEAIDSLKRSADDAVASVKRASDDALLSVSGKANDSIESLTKAAESVKEACDSGIEGMKQTSSENVESIKKASAEATETIKQASVDATENIKQASAEATETIKQVVADGLEGIKQASGDVVKGEAPAMDQTYLDAQFDDVHEAIHTENVKVYRNVQAAVDDSLADQTKAIRGYIESAGKDGSKLPVVLGVVNFALDIIILAVLVLHTMGIF